MADLTLGPTPNSLELNYVLGDPATYAIMLRSSTDPDADPVAWPEAPVIEFYGTELSFDSELSASAGSGVDDIATWSLTEEDVEDVHVLPGKKPRITVGGVTWWQGAAINRG